MAKAGHSVVAMNARLRMGHRTPQERKKDCEQPHECAGAYSPFLESKFLGPERSGGSCDISTCILTQSQREMQARREWLHILLGGHSQFKLCCSGMVADRPCRPVFRGTATICCTHATTLSWFVTHCAACRARWACSKPFSVRGFWLRERDADLQ